MSVDYSARTPEEIPDDGPPQEVAQEILPQVEAAVHHGGEDPYHLGALFSLAVHVSVGAMAVVVLALPALFLNWVVHLLEGAGVGDVITKTFVVIEHCLFFLDVWFFVLWLIPTVLKGSAHGLRWCLDSLWQTWAILRGEPD